VRVTFGEGTDGDAQATALEHFARKNYIAAIVPADYLRHECGASFDVELVSADRRGLQVKRVPNALPLEFDNPPFCEAFFGWDDIDEVHIY
jgi:hypothetical protein